MNGKIFDIKRFAVHDGDGIRTTVFMKGCPLKCKWCHNPEGISFEPQIGFIEKKCLGCGECFSVCKAHKCINGKHFFERNDCVRCGRCTDVCLGNALSFYGKTMSSDEIVEIVLTDKKFYDNSNGGITLSGGECLCQPEFCREVLEKAKGYGINTAVDTCGFVDSDAFDMVMPFTDVFLYDVKAIDRDVHIFCTGQPNDRIIENLKYISNAGKTVEIRIPYIPDFNSGEIGKIGEFLSSLDNITKVTVLKYNNLAGSKYKALGMKNTQPKVCVPSKQELSAAVEKLKKFGLNAEHN